MTIIIHFTDPRGVPSWLDGPYHGTGHCYPVAQVSPPREGWQVDAKGVSLENIKTAIFMVDEDKALRQLEAIGCKLQTTPTHFKRRVTDRLIFPNE